MTREKLRAKIGERIEFLADHWASNDKKPFNFGGWKDEVVDTLLALFNEYMEEIIGEDEIVRKTDDIQEIDVSRNNAEVKNQFRAELRAKVEEMEREGK